METKIRKYYISLTKDKIIEKNKNDEIKLELILRALGVIK